MKDYSLYYCDQRLEEAEVVELLKLAWDELYELEFDAGLRDLAGGSLGSRKRIPCTSPGKTCIGALS